VQFLVGPQKPATASDGSDNPFDKARGATAYLLLILVTPNILAAHQAAEHLRLHNQVLLYHAERGGG